MFAINCSKRLTIMMSTGLLLFSKGAALADESGLPPASASTQYEAPQTPELYDRNGDGPGRPVEFGKNFYLSPSLSFGQSKSRESGAAGSVAHSFQIEGGRRAYLKNTRLVDASLLVWTGKISDTLSDMKALTGFMARVGYGYRIGQDIWGMLKLGAGLVSGDYSGKTKEGYTLTTDEAASGSVLQAAFYLANQLDEGVGFFGGIRHGVYNFDLGTVKINEGSNVVEQYGKGITFAVSDIEVGLQFVF